MHHHNTFILNAIAKQLKFKIEGNNLVKCFSNSVDELYFEFSNFAFRCIFFQGDLLFSFETETINENRLFKPQFQEIVNLKLLKVSPHLYERSFHFEFENNFKLLFKCHGRKSNIVLYENEEALVAFRKNLENDIHISFTETFKIITPNYSSEISAKSFFQKYPYLPKEFYIENISQPIFETKLNAYNNLNAIQWHEKTFDIDIAATNTDATILNQITAFTNQYLKQNIFDTTKYVLEEKLAKAISEKENFIKISKEAYNVLVNKRNDDEIGNIILSNIHMIPEGVKGLELLDIYNDKPIFIKLDEKLNAVDNAAQYFKKSKAKPFTIKLLSDKIQKAEMELQKLKADWSDLIKADSLKQIKKLTTQSASQLKSKEEHLPYKYFEIEGYEILVGKHAQSNDKLLSHYSHKDDIWLHAKDVGGSHVLIKVKRHAAVPSTVLEKAASLAAYYSKSRNQSLATVTYTTRKFVRKIKGADKGLVTVSNEKTLLVKPNKPQN
jgi:predicted ribosome quality control (RQC) complex YloA/Tae2 family protein